MCVCSVANTCSNCSNPWAVAHQAPLSTKFSKQEYWNRLLFPILGIFPIQRSNLPVLHTYYISCITDILNTENNNKQIRLTSYQKYWKPKGRRTYVLLKEIIISTQKYIKDFLFILIVSSLILMCQCVIFFVYI